MAQGLLKDDGKCCTDLPDIAGPRTPGALRYHYTRTLYSAQHLAIVD